MARLQLSTVRTADPAPLAQVAGLAFLTPLVPNDHCSSTYSLPGEGFMHR
ncbi:unnamed protein product, partial [Rhizoctonia solani]